MYSEGSFWWQLVTKWKTEMSGRTVIETEACVCA